MRRLNQQTPASGEFLEQVDPLMMFLFYTHSLVSDWNQDNTHFVRGVMRALLARGHTAIALEPKDDWSRPNLEKDREEAAVHKFANRFPDLRSIVYDDDFDHEEMLERADAVVVHDWTGPGLVSRIGQIRKRGGNFTLLFHDTHHRADRAGSETASLDLDGYDGVLAFGEPLRQLYLDAGWGRQACVWHEAADVSVFHPLPEVHKTRDVIWIGNWGNGERSEEILKYFVTPASHLLLKATVRGVGFPAEALASLEENGIDYGGWIANCDVPQALAEHRATVHIPRGPFAENLPGIPTIGVFQALACGIPLISAPWEDMEGLFRTDEDFLIARNGTDMERHLLNVLNDPDRAAAIAESGLETIRARHTCSHRADELLTIVAGLQAPADEVGRPNETTQPPQ